MFNVFIPKYTFLTTVTSIPHLPTSKRQSTSLCSYSKERSCWILPAQADLFQVDVVQLRIQRRFLRDAPEQVDDLHHNAGVLSKLLQLAQSFTKQPTTLLLHVYRHTNHFCATKQYNTSIYTTGTRQSAYLRHATRYWRPAGAPAITLTLTPNLKIKLPKFSQLLSHLQSTYFQNFVKINFCHVFLRLFSCTYTITACYGRPM